MNFYPHRRAIVFPSTKVISCAACDELLDVYLNAELANINVKHYYAEVWQHLQTCGSCAAYHDWLYRVLRKNAAAFRLSSFYQRPFDLSFLPFHQPQPTQFTPDPPWQIYLRPRLLGEPFLLNLVFSPHYLQGQNALFQAESVELPATSATPCAPRILLQQQVLLPEQEIVVRIIAYPLAIQSGLVRLQATLSTPPAFSAKLQAKLQWGRIKRSARFTARGEADLGPVLLAPRQASKRTEEDIFAVTFEAYP